jgi:Tfp pilus assembly protein PilF
MSQSNELEQAIQVIQAGDREKGRQLLRAFIKTEPRNKHAWQWLAYAVDSADQRRYCPIPSRMKTRGCVPE